MNPISYLNSFLKKRKLSRDWRKKNAHNKTFMVGSFNPNLVHVGRYTYGGIEVINYSETVCLSIGSLCSIAPDVLFVVCGDHKVDSLTTFPCKVRWSGCRYEAGNKGNTIVDDDVWIGTRATILSGVHIGQGAVICAGSVVTKDVPPYAMVAGVPARVIKYRFPQDVINELLKIDYRRIDDSFVKEHMSVFTDTFSVSRLCELEKFPHK